MAPGSFRILPIIAVSALGFLGLLTFLGFIYDAFNKGNEDEDEQRIEKSQDETHTNVSRLDNANSMSQGELTPLQIEYLLGLIDRVDEAMLENLLVSLSNCCAFTRNQNLIREKGGLAKLVQLLHHEKSSVRLRAIQTLSNLAMNLENQTHISVCIPNLLQAITQVKSHTSDEEETVAVLQLLVNLSVVDTWHSDMVECIDYCFDILETDFLSPKVKMNALRLLVNLSCNAENADFFLNDQKMLILGSFMDSTVNEDTILRTVTLLLNMLQNATEVFKVKERALPQEIKQKLDGLESCGNEEIKDKIMKIKIILEDH